MWGQPPSAVHRPKGDRHFEETGAVRSVNQCSIHRLAQRPPQVPSLHKRHLHHQDGEQFSIAGLGDNDVRHRFVLTLLGESPNSWTPLLRNFKVSMLTTLQSPRYYTIFAGFDVNGDGFPFSDRVGPIGRNTYRGDASYTTDVRVQRVFRLSERVKAQASAEVFNLFNRQNVNAIDTVYGAPAFSGRSR